MAYVEVMRAKKPRARRGVPGDGGDTDRDQSRMLLAAPYDAGRRGRRPARDLVRRLIEYEKMKLAGES